MAGRSAHGQLNLWIVNVRRRVICTATRRDTLPLAAELLLLHETTVEPLELELVPRISAQGKEDCRRLFVL